MWEVESLRLGVGSHMVMMVIEVGLLEKISDGEDKSIHCFGHVNLVQLMKHPIIFILFF